MKIVIIGANGRLGSDVLAEFQLAGEQPVGLTYEDRHPVTSQTVIEEHACIMLRQNNRCNLVSL
jgi:putative NADH-flavin reductase